MNEKECSCCHVVQPLTEYYLNKRDGHISRCRTCCRAAEKRSRTSRPKAPPPVEPRVFVREEGEEFSHTGRPLTATDLTPCTRCGLRGHEPGDPDRCLRGVATLGMGAQSWV